jgi:CRISPR/Cas system-associated endoribonuclease Cas2
LRRDESNSLVIDLKSIIRDLMMNVSFYPVPNTCFKGRRKVGERKKYEVAEEKVAYF